METKKHSKMAWLWENMKGYRIIYVIGILGTIVYNVMQLTVPYITQNIIDLFLTGENASANLINKRELFYQLIIAMIVLTLVRTLVVYLVCMDVEHVSQKVLYRVRTHLFDKIERQDMQFYNTYRTGDLMTRVTGDLDAVRHMIASCIPSPGLPSPPWKSAPSCIRPATRKVSTLWKRNCWPRMPSTRTGPAPKK